LHIPYRDSQKVPFYLNKKQLHEILSQIQEELKYKLPDAQKIKTDAGKEQDLPLQLDQKNWCLNFDRLEAL
jgi:hypothetical protein